VGIECNTVPLDAIRGFAAPRAAARDLLSLTNSDRYPGADKIWSCASAGEVRGIAVRIWLRRLTFIIGLCCVCLSGLAWKLEKQVPWAAAARSRAGENNEASEMVKNDFHRHLLKLVSNSIQIRDTSYALPCLLHYFARLSQWRLPRLD